MEARPIHHRYEDPLEVIWKTCAQRVGFEVTRSPDTFASYDGHGRILISTDADLDPDDHLGQMIFHELCHALVEGDEGEKRVDWGLDPTRSGNPWREQACLRTQAWISQEFGLRGFMAPTTQYRTEFWDLLGEDPLDPIPGSSPKSITQSRLAIRRYQTARWHGPMKEALETTAFLGKILLDGFLNVEVHPSSVWATIKDRPRPHPSGHATIAPESLQRFCLECAWSKPMARQLGCTQAPRRSFPKTSGACSRFEPRDELLCESCGACCREAYDAVEIGQRDPILKTHPELVMQKGGHFRLARKDSRCAALETGTSGSTGFRCTIYSERPKTCRDFTLQGPHCLEARKRLGISL